MARGLRHLKHGQRVSCAAPPGPLDFVPPQVRILTLTLRSNTVVTCGRWPVCRGWNG
ncbi:hypothetical protein AB0K14_22775 [Actinosynnema sp. NPDC050801]|uniref:hypothetical protein n=1 Tax=unclassified Actinosynnema TaxID=2637065 RepID=UPI0033D9E864